MSQPTKAMVHIDRALTNIAIAYKNEASDYVATDVFPEVPVRKQSDLYFIYDKESWLRRESNVKRAPGTESSGGGYTISNESYYCDRFAFHMDLTPEDYDNADTPLEPEADATEFVTEKLMIEREHLFMSTFFASGVWNTDIEGVASGATGTQVLQWNDESSTPIADIKAGRLAIKRLTGKMPNVLLLGMDTFEALSEHPDFIERIKYTQMGVMTESLIASIVDVEKVVVGKAVSNTANEGATEDTDFIAGKSALLCYANPRPGIKKPSAGYIFGWKGAVGNGAMIRVKKFDLEQYEVTRVEASMNFDMKVISTELGYFFKTIVA